MGYNLAAILAYTPPTDPGLLAAANLSTGTLVSLAQVKSWLGITNTTQDAILISLIASTSRRVLSMLDRGPTLGFQNVTEVRDGTGGDRMQMRYWPVINVSAVAINGSSYYIQTDKPFGSGFFWTLWQGSDTQGRQLLYVAGLLFPRCPQNVVFTYQSGYVTSENLLVPQAIDGVVPLYAPLRPWLGDLGLIYASTDIPLVQVASDPAIGQYAIVGGQYQFSVADANAVITLSYSYLPDDLSQAVIDVLDWHFKNMARVGIVSKGIMGQETISFSQKAFGDIAGMAISPFKDVSPLC